MSHALAEVVHAELFYVGRGVVRGENFLCCPAQGCLWARDAGPAPTIGEQQTLARTHIAEAHTAAPSYDTAPTGRHAAGALIPEPEPAADDSMPLRVCEATGNTVRGPLMPVERPGQPRRWFCTQCFAAYRRSVAHVDAPLPLEGDHA